MQFQCQKCRAILSSDEVTDGMRVVCPECHEETECHPHSGDPELRMVSPSDKDESLPESIRTNVVSFIGIEKLSGFKLSNLFSEVFSHHTREEVDEYFTVGTKKSTPDILEVNTAWPKPWIFTRMIIASLVLYFLLWFGWRVWENRNFLPGLMVVGSFAIPISTLVLFVEMNVRRNVSLYTVLRLAFLGGILSLLITHLLPIIPSVLSPVLADLSDMLGDSVAGPFEETAKVLAMIALARAATYRYKLNGLLIGAAVGMGFAAFESSGYAFTTLLDHGTVQHMVDNINMRGLMSPFCHIVWSAIAGCALWRVIGGRTFEWRMLCDERFIRLFLVPVLLHMLWNSPLQLPYYGTYIIIGVIGWFVCLSLVQEGLREVAAEQQAAREAAGSSAPKAEGGMQ